MTTRFGVTKRFSRSTLRFWHNFCKINLNQKQMFFALKLSTLGPVLNKPLQLKRVTEGAEPPAAG